MLTGNRSRQEGTTTTAETDSAGGAAAHGLSLNERVNIDGLQVHRGGGGGGCTLAHLPLCDMAYGVMLWVACGEGWLRTHTPPSCRSRHISAGCTSQGGHAIR